MAIDKRFMMALAAVGLMCGALGCGGAISQPEATASPVTEGEAAPPQPLAAGPVGSFEEWQAEVRRRQATSGQDFVTSAQLYEGRAVEWDLVSWGGEVSTVGFETPAGRSDHPRVRFARPGPTDLGEVERQRGYVVACLADGTEPARLVQSDDSLGDAVVTGRTVVRGTLWGGTVEGIFETVWLRDCSLIAPAAEEAQVPVPQPTVPALTYERMNGDHVVEGLGFPAISEDARSILIFDRIEYGDPFVKLLSVGNRTQLRIDFPSQGQDLETETETAAELIRDQSFRTMRALEVSAPTDIRPGCVTGQICAVFDGTSVEIRRGENEQLAQHRPRALRLLIGNAQGRCVRTGAPTPPFRVEAWLDANETYALVRSSYEATTHGCELSSEHRVLRLANLD